MNVNIYTYQTIKNPGKKKGAYTYILEAIINEKAATISKTDLIEGTEISAELDTLNMALARVNKPCSVTLMIESDKLFNGINCWMPIWQQNGWKKSNGEELKNKEKWQQLWEYMRKFDISFKNNTHHEYQTWMHEETDRKERSENGCS